MTEPIRRVHLVRCPPAHAFSTFVDRIDAWWSPGHRRHAGGRIVLEPEVGGRFAEVAPSGEAFPLGEVVVYEPPRRLVYAWIPGSPELPTRVEVTFAAAESGTRVEVVHAPGPGDDGVGWAERAALFHRGWDTVLPPYLAACGGGAST